jgi:hypothetical protein
LRRSSIAPVASRFSVSVDDISVSFACLAGCGSADWRGR